MLKKLKSKFTVRYLVITTFTLVVIFIFRTLIINLFNLELSVFSNFMYIGLVACFLKDLILVLLEKSLSIPLAMSNVGSGAAGNPTGNPVGNPVGNPAANPGSANPGGANIGDANPGVANIGAANPPVVANPTGPGTFDPHGCDGGMGNSNWGPMGQQPAGRNTISLVIYGCGTVFNPAGGNQPFAHNLANALAFQNNHSSQLSRHVLNPSDVNFL